MAALDGKQVSLFLFLRLSISKLDRHLQHSEPHFHMSIIRLPVASPSSNSPPTRSWTRLESTNCLFAKSTYYDRYFLQIDNLCNKLHCKRSWIIKVLPDSAHSAGGFPTPSPRAVLTQWTQSRRRWGFHRLKLPYSDPYQLSQQGSSQGRWPVKAPERNH